MATSNTDYVTENDTNFNGNDVPVTDRMAETPINSPHNDRKSPSSVDKFVPATSDTPVSTGKNTGNVTPSSITQMENRYYKNFLNPMLADVAKRAQKNEEILDKINQKLTEDREIRRKALLNKHIPDILKGHGRPMQDIVRDLETMLITDQYDNNATDAELMENNLPAMDIHGETTILSYSLAAHIQSLDPFHAGRITHKLVVDCRDWLTKLFRFSAESNVYYHQHDWDGVVKICHLALHQRFTKYAVEGFEALYSRPPVIYLSSVSTPGYGEYICAQLGLPMSCLSYIPCNTVFGSNHKMDVSVFEKRVQDDIAAAKTPLLLVAYAGTPIVGHVDKLERLQEICEKSSIWLHVEGSHLATLTMFSVPTSVSPAKSGDSMTVHLSPWFGVAGLPMATLYKHVDPALAQSVSLYDYTPTVCLSALPLWVCLQSLGHEGIVNRVKHSCDLAKLMFDKLCDIPAIKQISKERIEKKDKKPDSLMSTTISSLISKAIHSMLIFEIVSPTVVFRFIVPDLDTDSETATYTVSDEARVKKEELSIYVDSLNAWLCDGLTVDNPTILLTKVDVPKHGICIRFAPLESKNSADVTDENIVNFIESLRKHVAILQTTVNRREEFAELVNSQSKLRCVSKPNWAGLGLIQYIPEQSDDINTINAELVHKLKTVDNAFSLGEVDGEACVRFGLICEGTELVDLVGIVAQYGEEIEEDSKYLEKMADVIQKGIDETNKALQTEAENKLRSEGVLRQMPLVGSLVNWWSPPPKNAIIGRSFNIHSGEIKSTQPTYKYHMQIEDELIETPATPHPSPTESPTPSQQTSSPETEEK